MTVEEHWQRYLNWCRANAPLTAATINIPVGARYVREQETRTGRRWPAELHTWFGLHNGGPDGKPFVQVFPSFRPLPADQVTARWKSLTEIWAKMTAEMGGPSLLDQPAGTVTFTYIDAYIPIAENGSGDLIVVDTRPGENYGAVLVFGGEVTDQMGIHWPSLSAGLAEIATSLENRQPCRGWVPFVENGLLDWDYP
ncbi:SMI1/KNR4 family protein [Nocardia fluminea]|uniref:SMI1/KNR4 family protein n=1 Tax=Nocardia fluminea TaxID=134984 RepID=UPI00365BBCF7